jgi:hypothetical protein
MKCEDSAFFHLLARCINFGAAFMKTQFEKLRTAGIFYLCCVIILETHLHLQVSLGDRRPLQTDFQRNLLLNCEM